MTLGNDFAGVVAAVGSGRASGFAIGERVYARLPWAVSEQILQLPGLVSLGAWAIRFEIQQLGDHPSGRDDVRQISVVTSKRRRSLGRARGRHQPRDRGILVVMVRGGG